MKLFLVRHGENTQDFMNPEKPLTEKGRLDVEKVAKQAKELNIKVDAIYHSGKKRSEETAEILAKYLTPDKAPVVQLGLNPNDNIDKWVQKIYEEQKNILIVGHLPFLQKLTGLLVAGDPEKFVNAFNRGTLAVLSKCALGNWMFYSIIQP